MPVPSRQAGGLGQPHRQPTLTAGARSYLHLDGTALGWATPEQAMSVDAAFDRLTERGETGMGDLFKVLAFSHPDLPPLPGFDLHRLPEQG